MSALRRRGDEGFSMIEVIVAIVIIGIVASSALWFFINGIKTSSSLERQQTAVSVATSAMELSFIHEPRTSVTAGVSGLVIGRPSADVNNAFSTVAALGVKGVNNSYALSDPAGGTPALPIKTTVTRAGEEYTVYTLVGACYRTASASGSAQDCDKVVGYSNEPATLPVGKARLLRIIVVVTWAPLGTECATLCTYDVSTLVDPSLDIEWNRIVAPVAVEDMASFAVGQPGKDLDLLDNDVVGSVPSYPVSIVSGLPAGAGTLGTPASNGTVSYTPPASVKGTWVSGIFDFTYRLRDSRGQTSQGVGHIYLQPSATNDNLTAFLGVPTLLDVTANDLGSPTSVTVVSQGTGSAVESGIKVQYTPAAVGYDTFTYRYADGSDLISPDATVIVNVQAVAGKDTAVPVPYRTDPAPGAGWVDVTPQLRGTTGGSASITVSGLPTPTGASPAGGQLRIDGVLYGGGTVTGNLIEFQPPANAFGEWTFPFALKLGTYITSTYKATMVAQVKANDDDAGNLKRNGTRTINVGTNDSPTTWPSSGDVTISLGTIPSGCGSWSWGSPSTTDRANGQVRISLPNKYQSGCKVTYTLTRNGVSSTATISYTVN